MPFVDRLFLSFPLSRPLWFAKNKMQLVGLPLRKHIKRIDKQTARQRYGFKAARFVLLVVGGSQGSMKINTEIVDALQSMDMRDIGVIHSTGLRDYERVKKLYEKVGGEKYIVDFIDDMEYAMSACDFMVARAGAGTIAEIIALRQPAWLIPYPFAKGHQIENANFLCEKKAAYMSYEDDVTSPHVRKRLQQLIDNPGQLLELTQALESYDQKNAREELAAIACKVIQCD